MFARFVEGMTAAEASLWAAQSEDAVDAATLVATEHEFVPLGFEAGGAFGASTLDFLEMVARTARAGASADLYHWSAMVWGEHWRQRLSLALARGQASLVLGAVAAARSSAVGAPGRKASSEWSPTDCQPCVSFV
eukprot:SAG11_NODE_1327_length_5194_cov_9.461237_2_plen_135_part_00